MEIDDGDDDGDGDDDNDGCDFTSQDIGHHLAPPILDDMMALRVTLSPITNGCN